MFQYHKCATFQSHSCKGCAMLVTPVSVLGKSDFTIVEVEKVFQYQECRKVQFSQL